MFEITGTLPVVRLLLVLSYIPICSQKRFRGDEVSFLDPLDQRSYKKSCSNGMVAEQDYFLLKGLINITRIPYGLLGKYGIYFQEENKRFVLIPGTHVPYPVTGFDMWKICYDVDKIKIDTCVCTHRNMYNMQFRCNLTAKVMYNRGKIVLQYCFDYAYNSKGLKLPTIYATRGCTSASVNRAARSHPESFTALLGTALLGTAVVCLVSSIISQI